MKKVRKVGKAMKKKKETERGFVFIYALRSERARINISKC